MATRSLKGRRLPTLRQQARTGEDEEDVRGRNWDAVDDAVEDLTPHSEKVRKGKGKRGRRG